MLRRTLIAILIVGLGFACNKEKKTHKLLDGTWNATMMTTNDLGETPLDLMALGNSMSMTFENCDSDSGCPVEVNYTLDGAEISTNAAYALSSDGTEIRIATVFEYKVEIVELGEDKLVIESIYFDYGYYFYAEFSKQ